MKVKISNIRVKWSNAQGAPYLDSKQRPYSLVSIQTEQHGKTWVSGFAYTGDKPLSWKTGDEVDVDIETKPNPKGGEYVNFRIPKASGAWTPDLIEKLFVSIKRIEDKVDNLELVDSSPETAKVDEDEIDPADMPF